MERRTWRVVAAVAAASGGIAGALLLGAPAAAALMAFVGGLLAFALLPAGENPQPAVEPIAEAGTESDILPGAETLLEAVDTPMLIVRDRRVLAANRPASSLLGSHIEGGDVRLAIRHPAAAESLVASLEAPVDTELVGIATPDDRWLLSVAPLSNDSRLVRLTDLSAALAAEKMRTDFVANASHELRTPLATLLGFLETLQDEQASGDAATRKRFLEIMLDEARRMRSLVDDLMSLSRIEAERFAVPRDPVDLVPLIDEVRRQSQQLIDERKASVTVETEASGTLVAGDRPQLAQMLSNLLANALKYGRPEGRIRIRLADAGAQLVRIEIADEGEGIAPEHLPRLTERFYRVDTGRSRSVGGTGLGLAIVKHIVLRHRGRLDIRSKLGEGTMVSVWLPRAHNDEV